MFLFMTESTGKFGVFSLNAEKRVIDALVTCSTLYGRQVGPISDRTRLMRRVANQTVFVLHFCGVGLMAFETGRHLFVRLMACCTEQL